MFREQAAKRGRRKLPSSSVRRRLLLSLGSGAMILIFLIAAAVYMLMARIEKNLWDSRQNDAARNASLAIASYMGQVSRSLDGLGMYEIADVVLENEDFLPTWLKDNPEFQEVILLTSTGEIIGAASYGQPLLVDQALQSSWYATAAAGFPTMSQVRISADQAPYIITARPADNGGVVASRLTMDVLWDVVSEVRFGKTGVAYIVEKTGTIVGHPDVAVTLNHTSLAEREEWQTISSAGAYRWVGEYNNFQGKDVLARTQAIANTDWVIITEIDKSEANATARLAVIALSFTISCLGLLAILSAARMMNVQIFRPLNDLRMRARRIAQGEFKKIEVKRLDELGELAQAFNDMNDALQQRDKRIAAQNLALSEEVGERKQAQENLQRLNTELVESSKYKDQFLATMSHELRTPLNAILGMSEALVVPVYGALNGQQKKAMLHIQDSGKHLLALIDDMLDLSKITAGRSPLNFTGVSIEEVVEASVRMVRPILNAKKIIFNTEIDPQVKGVMADSRRLKQIMVNLLSNACKFTAEGGQVALEIKGDAERGIYRIRVADTGIGIDEQALKYIFEPFMQAQSGPERRHGGAGLGLTLVNRIVEMHGGSVDVISEVGRGSCFSIELPWREAEIPQSNEAKQAQQKAQKIEQPIYVPAPEPQAPSEKQAASAVADGKTTILLVEDREANILTLIDYLSVKGYNVLVARSGREGIDIARAKQPDLILMDIHMPEMSGIEAIQHLRASVTTRTIPIVALTALAMPGDRERCLQAGANDYISKPISLRELLGTIQRQLDLSGRAKNQDMGRPPTPVKRNQPPVVPNPQESKPASRLRKLPHSSEALVVAERIAQRVKAANPPA